MSEWQDLPSAEEAERITRETSEKYARYVHPTLLNLLRLGGYDKVEWEGHGALLRDIEGNEYIDCLGGYGVFAIGHAHPRVVAAVQQQAAKLPMASKAFLNKPLADLCERLAGIAPGDLQYSFICNSGTEAVEAALKFARIATGRTKIVSTVGAYHGKSFGALSASGREPYKTPFAPLVPGFEFVPFGDSEALASAVDDQTAAVILEPIQGENGVRIPPRGYLRDTRATCDQHGALLILDEVQTGLGRTGKMLACEHENVTPDLLTLAKALGGGIMPIGATIGTAAIWEKVFKKNPWLHSTTFGGNELACAAALATLDVIEDEQLPSQAVCKGERLLTGMRAVQDKYPDMLVDVRGRGLMIGVEFTDADIAKLAISALVHRGVIAGYTLNNPEVMRFAPPLVIENEQIDRVISVFEAAIGETKELLADLLG